MTDTASLVAQTLRSRPVAAQTIVFITSLVDALVMSLSLWFASFATHPRLDFEPVVTAFGATVVSVVVGVLLVFAGAYRPRELRSLRRSLPIGCILIALVACLSEPMISGDAGLVKWVLTVFSVAAIPMLVTRYAARSFVRWALSFGALVRRAIIAGGGSGAEKVIRGLAEQEDNDIRVVAIFDDRDDKRSPPQVLGVPRVGNYWEMIGFVATAEIDLVIIAVPLEAEDRIRWLLATFKALPQQIHLADFARGYGFHNGSSSGLILAKQGSFGSGQRWRKRAFDLIFASLALLLLSPIMAAAALAIRLDSPGPIFFSQRRHGYANREIPVLKFRSMYHDQSDDLGVNIVQRGGDPRVTRVGAFLRKTSIDELPQLICVLKGDLSLVGPRPHALDARSSGMDPFSELVDDYASRHRLPPGITGWAQINGFRGGIDEPEQLRQRVSHDLYYIENWSLWFDLKILFGTPISLLNAKNAY